MMSENFNAVPVRCRLVLCSDPHRGRRALPLAHIVVEPSPSNYTALPRYCAISTLAEGAGTGVAPSSGKLSLRR